MLFPISGPNTQHSQLKGGEAHSSSLWPAGSRMGKSWWKDVVKHDGRQQSRGESKGPGRKGPVTRHIPSSQSHLHHPTQIHLEIRPTHSPCRHQGNRPSSLTLRAHLNSKFSAGHRCQEDHVPQDHRGNKMTRNFLHELRLFGALCSSAAFSYCNYLCCT